MGATLYVGNLNFATTERELKRLFLPYGTVVSARILLNKETSESRGYGYVEMGTADEARAAVAGLNGRELGGRYIVVREQVAGETPRMYRKPPPLGRRLRKPRPES